MRFANPTEVRGVAEIGLVGNFSRWEKSPSSFSFGQKDTGLTRWPRQSDCRQWQVVLELLTGSPIQWNVTPGSAGEVLSPWGATILPKRQRWPVRSQLLRLAGMDTYPFLRGYLHGVAKLCACESKDWTLRWDKKAGSYTCEL